MLVVFLLGLLFLSFRAARFPFVRRLVRGRALHGRLLCLAAFAAASAGLWLLWGMMSTLVALLHLVVIWLFCELLVFVAQKPLKKLLKKQEIGHFAGYAALILCALYLAAGRAAAYDVRETCYTLETDKLDRGLRIVQIADAHIGTTLGGEALAEYIEKINALSPDVVALTGDFVDDDTSAEELMRACEALGQLQARHGVFFVFGNHDLGYYDEELRGWTGAQLRCALTENGVTILEDSAALIDEHFYIVGRRDRSAEQRGSGRKTAAKLLDGLAHDKYMVVLDHQPTDFDALAAAGADLVLCGHTHGGQFFPIQGVVKRLGGNNLCYGLERREDTDFIVSSGISNWAFHFRTGSFSEYVVIDISPRRP